jgi:hypothetical protein
MDRLVEKVGGNGVWELRMICIECCVFDRLHAWSVAHGIPMQCEMGDKMARIIIGGVYTAPTQGASDENARELASYDMIEMIVTAEAAEFCRRVVSARRAHVSQTAAMAMATGTTAVHTAIQDSSVVRQVPGVAITGNAKSDLALLCQVREMPSPVYLHEKSGPHHAPSFRARITIGDRNVGWFGGVFSRQKEAEIDAAARGLVFLGAVAVQPR